MEASKIRMRVYDMYKDLDNMDSQVFDIYHDWILEIYHEVCNLIAEDFEHNEKELTNQLNKAKNLYNSAKFMNKACS